MTNEMVNVFFDMTIHGIFEKRNSMHMDMVGPDGCRGTVDLFECLFSYVTVFASDIDMEGFHGFIIGDSSGLIKLNGPPLKSNLDVCMCQVLQLGLDSIV